MKKLKLLAVCAIIIFINIDIFSQKKAKLVSFSEIEKMVNSGDGNIYIINFWATWCAPCLAELPDFQKFFENNQQKNVKLLLVSLDFPNEINKVESFIKKKNLRPPVFLISNTDQNAFINTVSKSWEGTIPATWFVNTKNHKKLLIEKPLNQIEINEYLEELN